MGKRKLEEGTTLANALQGKEEHFQEFLEKYGECKTVTKSFTKCVEDALTSLVRCKIPKEKGDGTRDLWLCVDCGWYDYTSGADRA